MAPQKTGETAIEDIRLAAYLTLNNIPLIRIERSGRLGTFVFNEAQCADLIVTFMGRKATVEPLSYMAAVRSLRSRVDNLKPEENGAGR
jgi:hypothetical protein